MSDTATPTTTVSDAATEGFDQLHPALLASINGWGLERSTEYFISASCGCTAFRATGRWRLCRHHVGFSEALHAVQADLAIAARARALTPHRYAANAVYGSDMQPEIDAVLVLKHILGAVVLGDAETEQEPQQ